MPGKKILILLLGAILPIMKTHGQDEKKDSLLSIVSRQGYPKESIEAFNQVIWQLDLREADSLYQILIYPAKESKYYKGLYDMHRNMANKLTQTDPVRSVKLIKESIELAEGLDSILWVINSKVFLGTTYFFNTKQEALALEAYNEANDLFKKYNINDKKLEGDIQLNFGAVHADGFKDFALARDFFLRARDLYREAGNLSFVSVCFVNLAEVEMYRKNLVAALSYYDSALAIQLKRKNNYLISYIHGSKGKLLFDRGLYSDATAEYQKALAYSDSSRNRSLARRWFVGLGQSQVMLGQHQEGITSINKALGIIPENDFKNLITAYKVLSATYDSLRMFQEASRYKSLLMTANDSLAARNQKDKLREFQVKYQVIEYQEKLQQAEEQKAIQWYFIVLLTILAFSILGITLVIIRNQKLKHKSIDQKAEYDRKLLEEELKIKSLAENELRIELDYKNKELTSLALNIIQKTELFDDIKKEIETLKQSSSDDTRNKLVKLSNSLNLTQRIDKDWENFKYYFEQVNKGFFDNLLDLYPDLSSKDLKLCALLKLNFDTKQIANIMDISADSVKVARHRMRKKLGLSGEEKILTFFNKLR